MRAMEHLQLDPLAIMARAQDLMLHSRVIDYQLDDWARLTYDRRKFFDWGGWLAVRPMDELPYWRNLMRREREMGHWREVEHEHHETIVEMRRVLRERGTVANRDFTMASRKRTDSYRGRKDSAVALYYLWRIGDAMVHHRERFERVYAPTEAIAPADLLEEASDAETDDFMRRKHVAFEGISPLTGSYALYHKGERQAVVAWRDKAVRDGGLIEIEVDGWRGVRWALAEDAADIATVERGRVPAVVATARDLDDRGDDLPRAARPGQCPQASRVAVRLRLHLGGVHAGAEAQVRLLRAPSAVGRPTGRAVRRPARAIDRHLRDPRPLARRRRPSRPTTRSSRRSPVRSNVCSASSARSVSTSRVCHSACSAND